MKKMAALVCVFLFVASVGVAQEMRLKSKDVKLTNKVRKVDAAELSKLRKSTRADLRPITKKMTFRNGKTLIYTDRRSGDKYYIKYDGKSSAKYIIKDKKGKNVPVTLVTGTTGSGAKAKKSWKVCKEGPGGAIIYEEIDCETLIFM